MANISKPGKLNLLWASGGDILDPGDTKYQTGWGVEVPPRQWENYIQNKQDQAIAHINQHGVAVWDAETEYQADTSYTQGQTNGVIYRAKVTHVGQNPELDTLEVYWRKAFAESGEIPTVATTAEAADFQNDEVFISPLKLAEAFSSPVNRVTGVNGYQIFPGGIVFQWCKATGSVDNAIGSFTDIIVNFPLPMTTTYQVQITQDAPDSAEAAEMAYSLLNTSTTAATARFRRVAGSVAGAEQITCSFFVIGFINQ